KTPSVSTNGFDAVITAEDADGFYSAQEVIWDDSASEWVTKTGGKIWDGGAGNLPKVYERGGVEGITNDTYIRINHSVGDVGAVVPVFDYGEMLPPGSGQYKVLQLDMGGTPHWDYARAHS